MISPEHSLYRFIVLLFTCLVTFGSYFCFDMPSVLQEEFEMNSTCGMVNVSSMNASLANVTGCCTDCLGMTPDQYNLLYAVYAWTNAAVVLMAGFFIDKVGNTVTLILFSFLCVLGSSVFALGAVFRGTEAMLPLMLVGRLVFGAGNGSLTVVQYRLVAFWFRNKELAMAFGLVLAVSRFGSVLNFLLSENFALAHGVVVTLFGGAVLCGLGFVSSIITSCLDRYGTRHLRQDTDIKSQSKQLRISDIRHFGLRYWLLNLTLVFYYSGIFPFVADASKFILDKYGYRDTAPYMAGAIYDVSLVLSPFLGFVVDKIGRRGWIILICSVLNIPVFCLLAFTHVHPLVCTIWLGVTYSFIAPSLWPSISLVVSKATVGTATGITSSLQMVGVGVANLVVGQILGVKQSLSKAETLLHWEYMMIYLLGNVTMCVISSSVLIMVDHKQGGVLNRNKHQQQMMAALENNRGQHHDSESAGDDIVDGEEYSDRENLLNTGRQHGSHWNHSEDISDPTLENDSRPINN